MPLGWSPTQQLFKIVTAQQDPATYDDLRWHFLHNHSRISRSAEALKACPGFPYEETIAEAWRMVRYDLSPRRVAIAPFAAQLGDKEALRVALQLQRRGAVVVADCDRQFRSADDDRRTIAEQVLSRNDHQR